MPGSRVNLKFSARNEQKKIIISKIGFSRTHNPAKMRTAIWAGHWNFGCFAWLYFGSASKFQFGFSYRLTEMKIHFFSNAEPLAKISIANESSI